MNRLYSMAQAFINKYNAEYSSHLRIRPFSDNGFNLPYINSNDIYIDKSNFILLAFYHFATPNLFLYYRLLKGLLDMNNAVVRLNY